MRSGLSATAPRPESTLPGTVFQADQPTPSKLDHPTPPDGVRTNRSIVPFTRRVRAGAWVVVIPGIPIQPLHALPFHQLR